MANYNLVINSKFQPFSFERYIQPYQIYGEAYSNAENQYSDLSTRAATVESMANEITDPIAYKQYKEYAEDLRNAVDTLATEGLTASSRPALLNLKRGYSERIIPIQNAYTTRQKYIDEQRKLRAQDNTIMFDTDADTLSLDTLMANPKMSYDSISGRLITARVADAMKNYKAQLMEDSRIGNWRSTAGGQLLERIEKTGLTREDIIDIERNPDKYPDIKKILDDAVASTGVYNWNNPNAVNAAKMYAYEGLPYGLGETKYQIHDNKDYMNAYQRWKWRQEIAATNPMPQSTTEPWGMEIVNKDLDEGYKGLSNNLVAAKYGKGLNREYIGNFKTNKDFVSPLKIKEEYEKYAKEHTIKEVTSTMESGGAPTVIDTPDYDKALKYIQNKYGVSKVLTNKEYDAAKHLGFSNESTFEEMAGTNINDRINASVLANSPTSLNLTSYEYPTKTIASNLSRISESNQKSMIYELSEGLQKGEGKTFEEVFGDDVNKPLPITDFAYTAEHPNDVIIVVSGKTYAVNPALLGQTWENIIKNNSEGIDILDNKEKGETQMMIAELLQNKVNALQPIISKTTSFNNNR